MSANIGCVTHRREPAFSKGGVWRAGQQRRCALMAAAARVLLVGTHPTLFLTVGLPGAGKTWRARELAREPSILRLTPDEWMAPLFGDSDAHGCRDILEGRMIWVAHEVLLSVASVILDFGCWSPEERYAIRVIAGLGAGDLHLGAPGGPRDSSPRALRHALGARSFAAIVDWAGDQPR